MVIDDTYGGTQKPLSTPATKAWQVTPSDSADLAFVSRAVWVGAAGNIAVTLADDTDGVAVTFAGVAAGTLLPLRVKRLWAAGTTVATPATNIVLVR